MNRRLRHLSRELRDRLVTDLHDLLAIPSVGGSAAEGQVQVWVGERLRTLGAEVRTWRTDARVLASLPQAPGSEVDRESLTGVVARLPGSQAESILLLGHTDVVPAGDWPDAFRPRIAGDLVTGRGAADMKAGVAAMIHVVRVLVAAGAALPRPLEVATVSAEEDGGLGTFDLLHHHDRAGVAACVIAEPTSADLVIANAGALGFRLTLHGQSAHAARRWEGIDALDLVAAVQAGLRRLEAEDAVTADPLLRGWPIPHPTSIGTIAGGDWASTVMATVTVTGRYGVPLGVSVPEARARFESTVARAVTTAHRDARADVSWEGGQFHPAALDRSHPMVRSLARAQREVTGADPVVSGTTYGSDLRLVLGAGIPAVCFGPGDAEQAHSVGEHVSVQSVLTWVDVILDWLLRS